ncbi:hypothetical protein RRG08_026079 [Elysia crispata]|uniref:Uncharacterized protein n=1 Tax=Elysia crispata TaxID=231223 RepID=A0AAE0YR25_9GAST|nr:hypothetical protein RRG08_026079 [Elysia crispata]
MFPPVRRPCVHNCDFDSLLATTLPPLFGSHHHYHSNSPRREKFYQLPSRHIRWICQFYMFADLGVCLLWTRDLCSQGHTIIYSSSLADGIEEEVTEQLMSGYRV